MVVCSTRQARQPSGAATLVVAVCIALAAASPTALAAGSTRLADACGKVTSPSATAAAIEECKSFKIYSGNAFTCDEMTRQSGAAVGDSLATVFTTMATGLPSGSHEAVHTVCALMAGQKSPSLAAACEAARDALAQSDAAFTELCKASFNGLPPSPPPPPGPCDRDWVYEKTCLDLFNKGLNEIVHLPDDYKKVEDCTASNGQTYQCTISVRPSAVTKDCCNIISPRCLCDMRKEVLASTKGAKVPHCFQSMTRE